MFALCLVSSYHSYRTRNVSTSSTLPQIVEQTHRHQICRNFNDMRVCCSHKYSAKTPNAICVSHFTYHITKWIPNANVTCVYSFFHDCDNFSTFSRVCVDVCRVAVARTLYTSWMRYSWLYIAGRIGAASTVRVKRAKYNDAIVRARIQQMTRNGEKNAVGTRTGRLRYSHRARQHICSTCTMLYARMHLAQVRLMSVCVLTVNCAIRSLRLFTVLRFASTLREYD